MWGGDGPRNSLKELHSDNSSISLPTNPHPIRPRDLRPVGRRTAAIWMYGPTPCGTGNGSRPPGPIILLQLGAWEGQGEGATGRWLEMLGRPWEGGDTEGQGEIGQGRLLGQRTWWRRRTAVELPVVGKDRDRVRLTRIYLIPSSNFR